MTSSKRNGKPSSSKKRVFKDYQEKLIQDLQDPESAGDYLNEALHDVNHRIFLLALKNIHKAQVGLLKSVEMIDQTGQT